MRQRRHSLFHGFDGEAAEVGDVTVQQLWVIFIILLRQR